MISSIEMTRFRGIREGKLEDLSPLTVLVGPNGCGKSTVLDALLIGASPEPGGGIARVVRRHQGVHEGPSWLFWRGKHSTSATLSLTTESGSTRQCVMQLRREADERATTIDCSFPGMRANGTSVRFVRGKANHDVYILAIEGISGIHLIESHTERLQPPLHELYSESTKTGLREEAKATISAIVPDITDIEILTEQNKPILYLTYKDCAIPVALAGDGIHALVRVTFELAARPEGVVLFEEPEVHQHPRAIHQTVRAILAAVRRGAQVVLTTHDLDLIDSLLGESTDEDLERFSVYRLHLDDGVLKSHRMPGSEVAFARGEIDQDLR